MATPFANPAVWWNAVQDQFQQAVSQAIAPAPAKKSTRKSGTAKKKPAASKDAGGSKPKQGGTTRGRRKPGESA